LVDCPRFYVGKQGYLTQVLRLDRGDSPHPSHKALFNKIVAGGLMTASTTITWLSEAGKLRE
jgi:hypothetical protein